VNHTNSRQFGSQNDQKNTEKLTRLFLLVTDNLEVISWARFMFLIEKLSKILFSE